MMNTEKGCVDSNSNERYKKLHGANNTKGSRFEYGLVSLLFLRSLHRAEHFQLASNMEGLGLFDDIFFKICWTDEAGCHRTQIACVQLKHRTARLHVGTLELINPKGNFGLYHYFKSYCKIQDAFSEEENNVISSNNLDDFVFIIYTNCSVSHNSKNILQLNLLEDILKTQDNGEIFSFSSIDEKVWNLRRDKDDNERYQHFLKRLRIFSGQSNAVELMNIVEKEVEQEIKEPTEHAHNICCTYIREIEKWWSDENTFLTERSPHWNRPVVKYLNRRMVEHLHQLPYMFTEDSNKDLNTIKNKSELVNLIVPDVDNDVRCHKLLAVLEVKFRNRFILVSDDDFYSHKVQISRICLTEFCHVLVVNITCSNDVSHLVESVRHLRCSVILVSGTKLSFEENFQYIKDIWSLKDLTQESQEKLLKNCIMFQGESVSLADLGPPNISPRVLSALLKRETVVLGGNLDQDEDLYISRTLSHRTVLREEVLKDAHVEDIFAVSAVPSHINLPEAQVVDNNTATDLDVSTVILSTDSENEIAISRTTSNDRTRYLELCAKFNSRKDVHWVVFEEGRLFWKESYGGLETPSRYIVRMSTHCRDEPNCHHEEDELLADWGERLVLITGEPGMGKTTLLRHWASKIKKRLSSCWVLHLALNRYSSELNKVSQEEMTLDDVLELLLTSGAVNSSTCPKMGKESLLHSIHHSGNIIIILDAVDDVFSTCSEQVLKMIQLLLETKIACVYITSRNILQEFLQWNLSVVPLILQPLKTYEQRQLLEQMMIKSCEEMTHDWAEQVDEVMRIVPGSGDSSGRNLCDVPLYTRMVADIILEYSESNEDGVNFGYFLQNMTICQMCEVFFARRQRLLLKKYDVDSSKLKLIGIMDKNTEECFLDAHMWCALSVLLTAEQLIILNISDLEDKVKKALSNELLIKGGIMNVVPNEKPQFVHHIFSEFLVSKWFKNNIVENYNIARNSMQIVNDRTARFRNVRQVVNSVLGFRTEIHTGTHKSGYMLLLSQQLNQVRLFLDHMLSEGFILHEAVLSGDAERVQAVLGSGACVNQVDKYGRLPLHLAASHGHSHLVLQLVSFGSEVRVRDHILGWSPLRYADRIESWEVANILLGLGSKKSDAPFLRKIIGNWFEWRNFVTRQKREIFMNALFDSKTSLVKALLESRTDYNYIGRYGAEALHTAVRRGSRNIVELLLDHGADIDCRDYLGRTVLYIAAFQSDISLVQVLLDRGANINIRDKISGRTPLQIALFRGNSSLLELLLDRGADINSTDNDGATALHLAASEGNITLTRLLLERGADISSTDNYGRIALDLVMSEGKTTVIERLSERGSDISSTDDEGK